MQKINWTAVVALGILGLLVLLVGGSLLSFIWGGGGWVDEDGWGMMGPGMMGGWHPGGLMGNWGFGPLGWLFGLIGLLIPLGLLILLVLGGVWLFRQVDQPQEPAPSLSRGPSVGLTQAPAGGSCPGCGKPVQTDWQLCPYCGQGLV